MSKESYARGFCKAAEAAGVDPVALAKYAQQHKTDGWAPEVVSKLGRDKPIKYYPPTLLKPEWARTMDKGDPSIKFTDGNADHPSRLKPVYFPEFSKYYNWLMAHQKARRDQANGKDYHASMDGSTGNVSRVSAPAGQDAIKRP